MAVVAAATTSVSFANAAACLANDTVAHAKAFVGIAKMIVAAAMTDEAVTMSSGGDAKANYPSANNISGLTNHQNIHTKK